MVIDIDNDDDPLKNVNRLISIGISSLFYKYKRKMTLKHEMKRFLCVHHFKGGLGEC